MTQLNIQKQLYENSPLAIFAMNKSLQAIWATKTALLCFPKLMQQDITALLLTNAGREQLEKSISEKQTSIMLETRSQFVDLVLYVIPEYEDDIFNGGLVHCFYPYAPLSTMNRRKSLLQIQDFIAQRVSDIIQLTSDESIEVAGKTAQPFLRRIRSSAIRLLKFNRNLSAYTDYVHERRTLHFSNLNVKQLLQSVATEFADIFTEKVRFAYIPPEADVLIVGDHLLLTKLLAILVGCCAENASFVSLTAQLRDFSVVISIRDNGQELNRLMKQISNKGERIVEVSDGDHLGMALVKPIVAEHKGEISVRRVGDENICEIVLPTGTDPHLSFGQYDTVYTGLSDVKVELCEFLDGAL